MKAAETILSKSENVFEWHLLCPAAVPGGDSMVTAAPPSSGCLTRDGAESQIQNQNSKTSTTPRLERRQRYLPLLWRVARDRAERVQKIENQGIVQYFE
jgi:hypothetical protein